MFQSNEDNDTGNGVVPVIIGLHPQMVQQEIEHGVQFNESSSMGYLTAMRETSSSHRQISKALIDGRGT